jgi:hypothetical protein
MSMFAPTGLAISLPGAELASLDLPGSVTGPEPVLAGVLSVELRAALLLVLGACRRRGVPVRVVARPEIFTHGEAERWLRARLGRVTQHLCISDGTTIKHVAGCRTHVFFYRLGSHGNYVALQRLSRRAPELVARVESQVNTAFSLGAGMQRFVPPSLYLTSAVAFPRPAARLMPFFFNKHSAEDTANRIEHRGEVAPEQIPAHEEVLYLPLTETALHDADFARAVAEAVIRAFYRPQTLLVLRLPPAGDTARPLAGQVAALLPRLRDTGVTIPRNCPPNVLLATDDLAEDSPLLAARPWTMMFHDSFDFWRHTEAFYRRAERVGVMAGCGETAPAGFLPMDVAPLFGARAQRVWLRDPALA